MTAPSWVLAQEQETPPAAAEQRSAIQQIERAIDRRAAVVVRWLGAVFFWDPFESTYTTALPQPALDVASVRPLVEAANAAGLEQEETSFLLYVPDGLLTRDQLRSLERELTETFTTGRARSFKVLETTAASGGFSAAKPGMPLIVLWLAGGALFFTLRMRFINLRGFKHAVLVTAGRYDDPRAKGEVNHFQALSAALSATVGLGNIAGVAIAVATGGPGATFWMIVAGLLGMTSKLVECTLGQMYREVRPDGRIMGGAMYYLSHGLRDLGLAPLGKVLAVTFAVMCVLASFGGGNAFQVNQSLGAVRELFQLQFGVDMPGAVYGLVMAFLVGIVILGGIRRIAQTAEKIVPLMCGVYVAACLVILIKNYGAIPAAIGSIVTEAFTPQAGYGALLGVLVTGFRRAAFSNEAGIGSAAIAHSAARTDYPVREGIVALLEPFIDTVVVCTMTALVLVITGAYQNPAYADLIAGNNGAALTSRAMGAEIGWFPYVLALATVLFAYSTMISWSYYGERCWSYLFGDRSSTVYRVIFIVFVFLGGVISATSVLDVSDYMLLGMAFPNILGIVLLSGRVKRHLDDYWGKYKRGELKVDT
jgi:AGCS family alanine or glycine:cation symporter